MLSKELLEFKFRNEPLILERLETLRRAEEINPEFEGPHIAGGFLRNIALGKPPRDCDVIFQGHCLNQPGILEAVREAEVRLGIEPYPEWEFENSLATGYSGRFYEDNIGRYSHHTDYLSLLLMSTKGELFVGDPKTISDIEDRVYDLRFSGIDIWAKHRGNGRSYQSCLVGEMARGLYMCQALDLTPSNIVKFLFGNFDAILTDLDPDDRAGRIAYWRKKTGQDPSYQPILDRFGITTFTTRLPVKK